MKTKETILSDNDLPKKIGPYISFIDRFLIILVSIFFATKMSLQAQVNTHADVRMGIPLLTFFCAVIVVGLSIRSLFTAIKESQATGLPVREILYNRDCSFGKQINKPPTEEDAWRFHRRGQWFLVLTPLLGTAAFSILVAIEGDHGTRIPYYLIAMGIAMLSMPLVNWFRIKMKCKKSGNSYRQIVYQEHVNRFAPSGASSLSLRKRIRNSLLFIVFGTAIFLIPSHWMSWKYGKVIHGMSGMMAALGCFALYLNLKFVNNGNGEAK